MLQLLLLIYTNIYKCLVAFSVSVDMQVEVSVMSLQNLEAPWLCDGTRLMVNKNVVVLTVVKPTHRQASSTIQQNVLESINSVLLPRIAVAPFDLSFTLQYNTEK